MKKLNILIASVLASSLIAGISLAAVKTDKNDAMAVSSAKITLDQATSTALGSVPGKIAKAEFSNDDDQKVWEIEVVSIDHKVFDLEIDASSGKIIKKQLDSKDMDHNHSENEEVEEYDDRN